MSRTSLGAAAIVCGWCLACTGVRDPGPLEEEWGQVLFWEVVDAGTSTEGCTDAEGFDSALTLPPLEPNTFFAVRIAADGKTATATECTETRAESCADLSGFDFTVEGHTLEHVDPPVVVDSGGDCAVSGLATWTMVDDGDLGVLEVALTFPFDGDEAACADLDTAIAAQGTNGDGLADCVGLITADLAFTTAD